MSWSCAGRARKRSSSKGSSSKPSRRTNQRRRSGAPGRPSRRSEPERLVTSTLEHELREQGDVLRRRVDGGELDAIRAAALLRDAGADHVVVAARGTSDNAARYAQYLLGRELRLVVALATPSLFRD